MPWESITLGSALSFVVNEINEKIDKMQEEADKLMQSKAKIEEKLTDLKALLNEMEDFAQRLETSGFYAINLSPDTGGWANRLVNANNAPPTSAEFYTAVRATLTVAPSPDVVSDAYKTIKDAFTKKIEIPEIEPKPPSPFNPYIQEKEEMTEDEWKSLALKDVFTGIASTVEGELNKVKAEVTKIQKVLDQIQEKYDKIMGAIDEFQQFLNKLNNTGIYKLFLEPDKGSWINRMLAEPGAPPTSGDYYSAGVVIVVCVPTLDECINLFNKLTSL